MNKDINLSIFFGQSSISELTNKQKTEINELCNKLSILIDFNNKNNNWNPNNYYELCKAFDNYPNSKENYKEAYSIYLKIKEKISITKRFKSNSSPFCKALVQGDWILIEQIESAPIEIIEKLIPLCEDKPELKIIKGTEEITYKINNKDSEKRINKNFRIFFTFNPYNRDKKIHPSLFSKCLVFTLPQIDSTPEYCSKIYYGALKNINYPLKLSKELSGRLANVHGIAKTDSINFELISNNNIINNEGIFTGRTIKFISNEITNLDKNRMKYEENINIDYLNNIIHSTFEHYYYNCFDFSKNEEKIQTFKKDITEIFSKNPPNFETEDDDLNVLYNDIYQDLEIISGEKNNNENKNNFKLSNFLNKCLTIKLMHLKDILKSIKRINLEKNIDNPKTFQIYQGFTKIIYLLENINNIICLQDFPHKFSRLIISDSKLLENKGTRISCSKLVLYNLLLKEKYIISKNIIPENLITKILKLSKSKIFYNFIELVSILYKYPYLFEVLKKLFPFEKLVEQKELTGEKENDEEEEIEIIKKIKDRNSIAVLWLELFYIYWKNKINFNVQFDKNSYYFNFGKKNNSILNPNFNFSYNSRYFLTNKSYFYFINDEQKEEMHKIEKVSRYESYLFYQLLYKFANYRKYIPSGEQYYKAIEESKEETEENNFFKRFKKREKNLKSFYLVLGHPEQNKKNEEEKFQMNVESDEELQYSILLSYIL